MHLIDLNTEVPGGWKYQQPETGYWAVGRPYYSILNKIMQHRANMKLPAIAEGFSSLDNEIQDAICRKLAPEDQVRLCSDAPPLPWPLHLRPFRLLAKEGDRGLGDIVARSIGPAISDKFIEWYKSVFGQDCGCRDRQIHLNTTYPL